MMIFVYVLCVVVLWLGIFALNRYLNRIRQHLADGKELLNRTMERLEWKERELEFKESELEALEKELKGAREASEGVFRILQAQININDDLIRERDSAWALYRNSALASGAGQQMLMREIERMQFKLKTHNIDYEVNPALSRVVNEFKKEHIEQPQQTN